MASLLRTGNAQILRLPEQPKPRQQQQRVPVKSPPKSPLSSLMVLRSPPSRVDLKRPLSSQQDLRHLPSSLSVPAQVLQHVPFLGRVRMENLFNGDVLVMNFTRRGTLLLVKLHTGSSTPWGIPTPIMRMPTPS